MIPWRAELEYMIVERCQASPWNQRRQLKNPLTCWAPWWTRGAL